MFWSGNYITGKQTSAILQEKNVTLQKLFEAEDLLEECRTENFRLANFLCQPKIIKKLITLIIEEPKSSLPLHARYRNAALACEVLTSKMVHLRAKLSSDIGQLSRLCDFLKQKPPLNPLLASYFSKVIEMLFQRGQMQDWCTNQIMCVRVLDFFQSRKDFLPNLFKHIGTSAIKDILKNFMQINSIPENMLLWFKEYELIDSLVQIVCGTYTFQKDELDEDLFNSDDEVELSVDALSISKNDSDEEESQLNGENVQDLEESSNGNTETESSKDISEGNRVADEALDLRKFYTKERLSKRIAFDRSHNATALICDLLCGECISDDPNWRGTDVELIRWCTSEATVGLLLTSMFTAPPHSRRDAIVNGILIIITILKDADFNWYPEKNMTTVVVEYRKSVIAALALHLPLLHQVLLEPHQEGNTAGPLRVQTARLISILTAVESNEVSGALVALGTFGVLLDLFFKYEDNNFLHTGIYLALKMAFLNTAHQQFYLNHIINECGLLDKIIDAWEDNEERKKNHLPRCGYTGRLLQLVELLSTKDALPENVPQETLQRWTELHTRLAPLIKLTKEPLGDPYEEERPSDMNEPRALSYGMLEKFNTIIGTWSYNTDIGIDMSSVTDIEPTDTIGGEQPWGSSSGIMVDEGWANFNDNNAFWDSPHQSISDGSMPHEDDPFNPNRNLLWEPTSLLQNKNSSEDFRDHLSENQTISTTITSPMPFENSETRFEIVSGGDSGNDNEHYIKNVVSLTNLVNEDNSEEINPIKTNENVHQVFENVDDKNIDCVPEVSEATNEAQIIVQEAIEAATDIVGVSPKATSNNNTDHVNVEEQSECENVSNQICDSQR